MLLALPVLLLGICIILFIPSLIVILWKRRPIWAFFLASVFLYLTLTAPGIIKTYQAMLIYGTGDPELMAGGISSAFVEALFGLPIFLPLLVLIQWVTRRRHKRKSQGKTPADTFT